MQKRTPEPTFADGLGRSAESTGAEAGGLDHQAVEAAVQYVLADCFFAVGQTIGMRMTVDYEAVIWWHDHFRAKFLAAMHRPSREPVVGGPRERDRGRVDARRARSSARRRCGLDRPRRSSARGGRRGTILRSSIEAVGHAGAHRWDRSPAGWMVVHQLSVLRASRPTLWRREQGDAVRDHSGLRTVTATTLPCSRARAPRITGLGRHASRQSCIDHGPWQVQVPPRKHVPLGLREP